MLEIIAPDRIILGVTLQINYNPTTVTKSDLFYFSSFN